MAAKSRKSAKAKRPAKAKKPAGRGASKKGKAANRGGVLRGPKGDPGGGGVDIDTIEFEDQRPTTGQTSVSLLLFGDTFNSAYTKTLFVGVDAGPGNGNKITTDLAVAALDCMPPALCPTIYSQTPTLETATKLKVTAMATGNVEFNWS